MAYVISILQILGSMAGLKHTRDVGQSATLELYTEMTHTSSGILPVKDTDGTAQDKGFDDETIWDVPNSPAVVMERVFRINLSKTTNLIEFILFCRNR
jgi:hypothetical protein